jgi:anti-anti-sigma factor
MRTSGYFVMNLKRTTNILGLDREQRVWKGTTSATRIRRKCVKLALTTRTVGEVAIVHCGGKLVFQREAAALCDVVSNLVRNYRTVVLDLNDVAVIDGGGIGTLVDCIHNAKASGANLMLCRVPKMVQALLDLTRVSSLVEIVPTEQDALRRSVAA